MLRKAFIPLMVLFLVVVVAQVVNLRVGKMQDGSLRFAGKLPGKLPGKNETRDPFPVDAPGDELREEFHRTYPLSSDGRLSLDNLNGGVRIKVWDRNEVQVDAIKRANKKERLDEVKIDISATADIVRIRTRYPAGDQHFTDEEKGRYNNPAIVDYSILIPRKARLESVDLVNGSLDIDGVEGSVKASSVNGRLTARGLMGEAKLSTVNGALEAVFTRLDEAKLVSLGSVNGSVALIIPSNSNATIRASTVHGGINNDFGLDVQHGEYVGHDLDGQLGTGAAKIKLGNVNGGISIKRAHDGQTLSRSKSLLLQKDKEKDKGKENDKHKILTDEEIRNLSESAREAVEESRREAIAKGDAARIARDAQVMAAREVEAALREAQHEIQRAQMEVERDTRQKVREQMRNKREGTTTIKKREEIGSDRFVEHEKRSFTISGAPSVNIVTYDGAVTVRGWDKPEVMYDVTKHGGDEEKVRHIRVDAKQQGSSVSIIARSEDGDGSAHIEVYLPRNATLHVSSDDGRLTLQGVSGDLTLRTGEGSIEVADGHGQLQVNTGDGRIQVSNFDGEVDARTGDGSIALNGAFSGLAARTGDGSISLAVPTNSHFTIETNADAISNEGLAISEDIAPSKRVKRWKVGGGGNVFVLSTGEGKIILRPR